MIEDEIKGKNRVILKELNIREHVQFYRPETMGGKT